jgi:hypothetical protein
LEQAALDLVNFAQNIKFRFDSNQSSIASKAVGNSNRINNKNEGLTLLSHGSTMVQAIQQLSETG